MKSFDLENLPDLSGKVIFVTGGSTGLGRRSIEILAQHNPAHIFFSGRNAKRGATIASEIIGAYPSAKLTYIQCDHSSFSSIDAAARQLLDFSKRLDILICNASAVTKEPSLTKDGYEVDFAINHLGHALLIKHLLPIMRSTAEVYGDARCVLLGSSAFVHAPKGGIDFDSVCTTEHIGTLYSKRYARSKLAVMLYGAELAKRNPEISVAVAHPGLMATELSTEGRGSAIKAITYAINVGRLKTVEQGVENQLWAATVDKAGLSSGTYYVPVGKPGQLSNDARNEELRLKLWKWTQEQIEERSLTRACSD